MPPRTMQEYITRIESGSPECREAPDRLIARMDDGSLTIPWMQMNRTQQFIMTVLFARSNERDEQFNQLMAEKPAGMTWQQMLDFCFAKEDRTLANQQLAERNRR